MIIQQSTMKKAFAAVMLAGAVASLVSGSLHADLKGLGTASLIHAGAGALTATAGCAMQNMFGKESVAPVLALCVVTWAGSHYALRALTKDTIITRRSADIAFLPGLAAFAGTLAAIKKYDLLGFLRSN